MTRDQQMADLQRAGETCVRVGIGNAITAGAATSALLAGWSPWVIVCGLALFAVVGFAQAFRYARKMNRIEGEAP